MSDSVAETLEKVAKQRGCSVGALRAPAAELLVSFLEASYGAGPRYEARWDNDAFVVGLNVEAVSVLNRPKEQVRVTSLRAAGLEAQVGDALFLPLHRLPDGATDAWVLAILPELGLNPGRAKSFHSKVFYGLGPKLATAALVEDKPQTNTIDDLASALRAAFGRVVPELAEGVVQIVGVVVEGDRAKVAVRSSDWDIDPIGAMVGMKGQRVEQVVRALGCTLDLVPWAEDPLRYLQLALAPAEFAQVWQEEDGRVVLDGVRYACSPELLADIPGREAAMARNLRLAAALVGLQVEVEGACLFHAQTLDAPFP